MPNERPLAPLALVAALFAATGAVGACAGGEHVVGTFEVDSGTSPDGGSHDSGRLSFGDVTTEGSGPTNGCSGDLHQVLGPGGTVIETCPLDEGCAAGKCVPACEAAAASKGTVGCDFMVSTPAFTFGILPPCFAAFAANNWGTDAVVQVSRGGASLDVPTFGRVPNGTPAASSWAPVPSSGLPPGGVGVLFLSGDPTSKNPQLGDAGTPLKCPVPDAINSGTAIVDSMYGPAETYSDTGMSQAFHIVTSVPVSLYDIQPYGGASSWLPSAQLVLPTTAWGDNFIVVSPKECTATGSPPTVPCVSPGGLQWLQVVATEDNTHVKIQPTQPLATGGGISAANPGVTTTYTVNAGDFVQWSPGADLTGTLLASDHPIAVLSGALLCLNSATSPSGGGCDSAHQTMLPVEALGFEYVAQPYATRRASLLPESIPYRLVGVKDGTTLTYDPAGVGPSTLNLGAVADFESTVPFTVRSQDNDHVFYMTQMAPGCLVTDGSRPGITPGADTGFGAQDCLGDEEFIDVLPPAQWLPEYVFFTDPTYGTTNVTVARTATASGFAEVTIDCIGTVTGWQEVGMAGKYQVANVDLLRATIPVGSCTNGGHSAKSTAPFGLVVWGLDEFASYAYPAGGNVATINHVAVPLQ
jgi:IgGFc binding protein